jgi:hypothetical protein
MQKKDVPQDLSALGEITKEISYAINENGKYETEQSTGWEVKKTALDTAWSDIEKRIQLAKAKVLNREASPVLYYMEKELMNISILANYTNFFSWQIKKHLKPSGFHKLSEKKLQTYAHVFNITVNELKAPTLHED